MTLFLIRCRSCAPVPSGELAGWLQEKVAELREQTPPLLVRLTRLVQDLPEASVDDGWLIEAELPADQEPELEEGLAGSLQEALRDMRILGLDPVLLVPGDLSSEAPALVC